MRLGEKCLCTLVPPNGPISKRTAGVLIEFTASAKFTQHGRTRRALREDVVRRPAVGVVGVLRLTAQRLAAGGGLITLQDASLPLVYRRTREPGRVLLTAILVPRPAIGGPCVLTRVVVDL